MVEVEIKEVGAEEVEIVEVEILLSVAMLILTRSSEQRTDLEEDRECSFLPTLCSPVPTTFTIMAKR